jgi:hypothetical protein
MARDHARVTRRAGDYGIPPLLGGLCMDCGTDTRASGEYYALKDALWRRINPLVIGMLCLSCAEDRLGRGLCSADFARMPVNVISPKTPRSLARRLKRPRALGSLLMVGPRLGRMAKKRAKQSRLGLASFKLMEHVGRNGRVKSDLIMKVVIGAVPGTHGRSAGAHKSVHK